MDKDLIKKLKKYYLSLVTEAQSSRNRFQEFSGKKGYSLYSKVCEKKATENEKIIKQLEELFPDFFHKTYKPINHAKLS